MRDIKLLIVTIGLIFTSAFLFAQNDLIPEIDSLELKPYQLKKLAKKADKYGDYYSAIDYQMKYIEVKGDKPRYKYILAELYRKSRDYTNALTIYEEVYEIAPEQVPLAKFYAAKMMILSSGDYAGAKSTLEEFKKDHKPAAKEVKKEYNNLILSCEQAEELNKEPLEVIVTHLDTTINKAHVEFSPILVNDTTLIYAALKEREINYYTTDSIGGRPLRQFYVAHKDFDDWTGEDTLKGPFNSPHFDTGNGAFSPDGKRFYFTRCEARRGNKVICSIFMSTQDETGFWEEPILLPEQINDPEFNSTQPAIGTHPKYGTDVIYFVSDRDLKSKGGRDIWYTYGRVKKEVTTYKTAKNLGRNINTVGEETTPFFDSETKTFYFSTDGFPGLGGLDVFKTTGQLNKWNKPTNVGPPINSPQDDLDFTIGKSQEEGFFVSNRKGGTQLKSETCCDDIYHFKFTQYIKIFITGDVLENLEEEGKSRKLGDATLTLMLKDSASGNKLEIKKVFADENGNYFVKVEHGNEYEVIMGKEGYLSHEIPFSTVGIDQSDTIHLAPVFLTKIPEEEPVTLKNIYYEFDKDDLTASTKIVIDTTLYQILVDNPEIIVEISSHTDSKGSDAYNLKLSQGRAESVVKYLIKKGISKKRMKAKGYGETKPIAPNENKDGSDNEAGRAKNRRTDFRVIGKIKGASEVIYEE